jgi:molybdenum cofactor biosynthesis protein B
MTDKALPADAHPAQPMSQTGPVPIHVRCAVLTVSDSRSPETDYGGRTVAYQLAKNRHSVVRRWIVPYDAKQVHEAIVDVIPDPEVDAMIVIGGCGLARREPTIEVLGRVLEKRLSVFEAVFGQIAYAELGADALVTRCAAGVTAGKLFIALPSHQGLCDLAMDRLVIPELGRIVAKARK